MTSSFRDVGSKLNNHSQNHSCDPNCDINPCYINEASLEKPLLTLFTVRDVAAGEELCFSYFGPPDDDDSEALDKDPVCVSIDLSTNDLRVHTQSRNYNDAVYRECRCGAAKCRKSMWT